MIRKQSISVLLMVIAILAIIAFQVYWLKKTYREEEAALKVRAGFIFRETLFELQGAKLGLDSASHIRIHGKKDLSPVVNVLRMRATAGDSIRKQMERTIVFSEKPKPTGDSSMKFTTRNDRIYNILLEVDSLQDTLTVKEIETGFRNALKKQDIPVDFFISRKEGRPEEPHNIEEDRVTVGLRSPVSYAFSLINEKVYLYKQISSQMLFSFFLVGLTLFSFISLYRNLQAQKKLTVLKNDFINNITHELKTPIATVSVAIEAMKNFNVLEDPARSKEYLEISASELQRLSLLVDKVLKLSMFENKEIELSRQSIDLPVLINEVINTLKLQIEKQQVQVVTEYASDDLTFHGDRLHITSVLYNLIDNALKYCSRQPFISISLKKEAGYLLLTVSDNGIGIPPTYKEKVFEKFFRVPGGDRHNVKGYGLGLSYVAYVIEKHHGSIRVESEENAGSSFIVKLPVNG